MVRDFSICVILVAISAGLAGATNVLRPDKERRLDWIRRGVPVENETTPSASSGDGVQANGATSTAPANADHGGAGGVTVDEVLAALSGGTAYFVDAREKAEYEEGHLRGAVNMPSSAIYENADSVTAIIPPDARVIVYCGGGQCEASHNVSDALRRDFAYQNVVIYTKGWEEVLTSGKFGELISRGDQP